MEDILKLRYIQREHYFGVKAAVENASCQIVTREVACKPNARWGGNATRNIFLRFQSRGLDGMRQVVAVIADQSYPKALRLTAEHRETKYFHQYEVSKKARNECAVPAT